MDERDLKLVLAERDFEQIFQHAPVGLCVLDREYRYLMINARMAQLNGHPVADHLGRSVDEMVPGLAEKIKAELRPVLDNGEPGRGRLFAGPLPEDPSKVGHWLANYFPLRSEDGSVRGVIATLVEITELKRVERELRLSEGRLELALRAGNLGIWDGDLQTGQYYFSDQYKRMLGYEPEEIANDSAAFFRLLHPEDTAAVTAAYAAHLRGDTPLFRAKFRLQHKDGSWRWIRSEGQAERDPQGRPLRVAGVHVEITEIKQAEELLREAKRAAEEANTAKRQFLASMSHEMRTPLTAIIGFSELLADRDVSAEKQVEYVEATQRNARLLLMLVDEVLDFSKIEAGKMELAPQDCLLHEVLQDVLSATGQSAEKKQLRLELNCRYPLPERIRTDPRRLWQILVNLVTNAVKFTERGGVWITVKMEPAGPEGARLRFTVGDTGPGVAPEFESRLFEPFAQAAVLAPGGGGVGLGLPIAARLAELLGTRLELDRRSAQGASFSFVLDPGPLDRRRMLWGEPGASEAELPLADRLEGRVLLAEDATDTQQLFRVYLQNAGLHVDVVDDGLAAVRRVLASAASAAPYDLVLLDLQLPHLDGYEAARLLRASAWSGPLLALGAHAATDDGEPCRDAGFDQVVSKPITREILLAAVQRCLPQRHPRGGAAATTAPSAPASGHLNERRLRAPSPAVPAPTPSPSPRERQAARRYRVLLADDDDLVRAALRLLVDQLTDFEVVAEAADGREALESLRRHQPEIALMDIAMPHLDGLNATARVAAVSPHTKVIILSAFAGQETVLQALQAGAAGYLLKNAGPRELERALSAVAGGGTYYGEVVQQHVPAQRTN